MTPELALQQNPWIVQMAQASLGLLGFMSYMFDHGEVEQDAWPKNNPVVETQIIRYRLSPPRQRMRIVGRQWIGWDATAPATHTIIIDDAGASAYGVRCTFGRDQQHEPQEVEA